MKMLTKQKLVKTITRSNIYVSMAAMMLTVALAIPAAAQNHVPFKGAMQGHDTDGAMPTETTLVVTTSGTGIGTLLGQFSFSQEFTVDFIANTQTGSAHWVAANGDTIDTTLAGSGEFTADPNVLSLTEIHTITGGTGRFAGAQGSFTVERLANVVTFVTSGSFHGTITSPGAANWEQLGPASTRTAATQVESRLDQRQRSGCWRVVQLHNP